MVSGGATEPEERGKGHMHRTMLFLREAAREQGIQVLFNHPQNPDGYKRLGFLPCTDTLYLEQPASYFKPFAKNSMQTGAFSEEAAFAIYRDRAEHYSAFSVRDEAAFSLRIQELSLDGGEALLFYEREAPIAYCLYHREGCVAVCDEILSRGDYASVLSAVCRVTGCSGIRAKLPPDTPLPGERRVQNIMLAEPTVYAAFGYGRKICYSVDEY